LSRFPKKACSSAGESFSIEARGQAESTDVPLLPLVVHGLRMGTLLVTPLVYGGYFGTLIYWGVAANPRPVPELTALFGALWIMGILFIPLVLVIARLSGEEPLTP
jgi:hypothetical protein